MKFRLSIHEHSYLDDYNDGEIDGTFQIARIEEKFFNTIQEVIKYFYDRFDGSRRGIYKFYEGVDVRFGISFMAKAEQYGFEEPTENEMKLFKEGKIKLYNVEYLAKIEEVKPVAKKDIDNALEGIGFEVTEG